MKNKECDESIKAMPEYIALKKSLQQVDDTVKDAGIEMLATIDESTRHEMK